jgi:integral membrane sensor domain MASE1
MTVFLLLANYKTILLYLPYTSEILFYIIIVSAVLFEHSISDILVCKFLLFLSELLDCYKAIIRKANLDAKIAIDYME